jgi:hypothetical protein
VPKSRRRVDRGLAALPEFLCNLSLTNEIEISVLEAPCSMAAHRDRQVNIESGSCKKRTRGKAEVVSVDD